MTEKTIAECSCPVCVEFQFLIQAWNEQRKQWHKKKKNANAQVA
jgi:hypothetical protein